MWSSTVNVVLVEAKNLLPTEPKGNSLVDGALASSLPDPYVKFKLGTEKYKSKVPNFGLKTAYFWVDAKRKCWT